MPRTIERPAHVPIVDDAPMNLMQAVDAWLAEDSANGRINSEHTRRSYRLALKRLSEEVDNRSPHTVGKADIQRTLAHWNDCAPATRAVRHAAFNSFFAWCVFNDICKANPAKAVRPTVVPEPDVPRITRDEALRLLKWHFTDYRARWLVHIGLYTGARRGEMVSLTRRDLMRDGYIRLDGKGNKVRWVPIVPELQPVVDDILERVAEPDHYVFCRRVRADGRRVGVVRDIPDQPCSPPTLNRIARLAGNEAGLVVELSPHVLRRMFAEAMLHGGNAGELATQAAMGHRSFDTTLHYAGSVPLDRLTSAMTGWGYVGLSHDGEAESADVR